MHRTERAALSQKKLRGETGFDKFYSGIYGDRWQGLKAALLREANPVRFDAGGEEPYFLDAASLAAASFLPLDEAEKIIDMCAAPGGKTVVLASRMKATAALVANDRSASRVKRLAETCKNCLAPETAERVSVTCCDSAKLCRTQGECYDAILLDAPCSSERHVLCDAKELAKWSEARIRQVTTLQWALLSCAFRLLRRGGFLLYSTCAINQSENDEMLQKLLARFPNSAFLANEKGNNDAGNFDLAAEKTKCGQLVLPDTHSGAGPLYFSLVQKK